MIRIKIEIIVTFFRKITFLYNDDGGVVKGYVV